MGTNPNFCARVLIFKSRSAILSFGEKFADPIKEIFKGPLKFHGEIVAVIKIYYIKLQIC